MKLTNKLLPLIKKSKAGRIVNLSSILGSLNLHADPASPIYDSKLFAYNASKTALNAYTVHLAHALKNTGIKVNAAHPGWVKTDICTSDKSYHGSLIGRRETFHLSRKCKFSTNTTSIQLWKHSLAKL